MKPDANNAYLVTLVDQAKVDGGRTLPLVDSASLATARQEIEAGGRGLNDLAFKDLHSGNLEHANTLASQALVRNPSDLVARAIKDDIAKKANGAIALAAGPSAAPARQVGNVVGEPGDLNLQGDSLQGDSGLPPPEGAAAAREINQNSALEQQWQKDVQSTINQARGQVALKPDAAAALIRNKTNELMSETTLGPEMRDRLMGMLHSASREIQTRTEENTARDQQRIRETMAQREMAMTNAALQHDEDKVDQLMKRFDSLLADARQRLSDRAAQDAISAMSEAQQIALGALPSAQPTMVAGMHLAQVPDRFGQRHVGPGRRAKRLCR